MLKKFGELGLSLLEVLIVISITALISIITVPGLRNFADSQNLDTAIGDLKNSLRTAESRAISGIKCSNNTSRSTRWTVQLKSTSFDLVPYCDPGNGIEKEDTTATTIPLPKGITITQTGCPVVNGTEISFRNRSLLIICSDRSTLTSASVTLTNSLNNKTQTIKIGAGGVIGD